MSNGAASLLIDSGPRVNRSSTSRRVGSATAVRQDQRWAVPGLRDVHRPRISMKVCFTAGMGKLGQEIGRTS
jgi:hypothetical protein